MVDRGAPRIAVVVDATGDPAATIATLRSLARQEPTGREVLVTIPASLDPAIAEAVSVCAGARVVTTRPSLSAVERVHQAAAQATADLITLAEPGDELLPGTLGRLDAVFAATPGTVMAHAFAFDTDTLGRVSQRDLRRRRAALLERFPPGLNHRRDLVVQGNMIQAMPTFTRAAFTRAAGLRGATIDAALYALALRVLECGEIEVVGDFLCCRGPAAPRPSSVPRNPSWFGAVKHGLGLLSRGEAGHLWSRQQFSRYARIGLADRLLRTYPVGMRRKARRLKDEWGSRLRSVSGWRLLTRVVSPYALLGRVAGWWTPRSRPRSPSRRKPRVGYALARYPLRSDTFIRREILALRQAGVDVGVFVRDASDGPDDGAYAIAPVTTVGSTQVGRSRSFLRALARRSPWRVLSCWLWVIRHQGRPRKTYQSDLAMLYQAATLALQLREQRITHVHSPWANEYAMIAMLAARLTGATFSAQARASEVRRTASIPFVADRVRFADFLITNCRYNEAFLRSLFTSVAPPIHVVNEGVDLERFAPREARATSTGPFRILAVARLVEPKGLELLVQAMHALRSRGADVTCDILGGPEESDIATWVRLRMLIPALGLEDTVRIRGSVGFDVVLGAMRGSDAFVLPCVKARDGSHDITPNSLIEAMAMGLPVVSTTSGAIPEIVEHEVSGLLVAPGEVDALVGAVERVMGDPGLRLRLGVAARRRVEERFELHANIAVHARLFGVAST